MNQSKLVYLISFINDDGIMILTCWLPSKICNVSEFNSDSSEISIIWRFLQFENEESHIFDTFEGIKIDSILELLNAHDSIVCKFEFVGISTFIRLQLKKAYLHILDTFDGIKIDSIFEYENAFDPIISNSESSGALTFIRFS